MRFSTSASGGIAPYHYLWSFGDGNASANGSGPTHTYLWNGTFQATVLITDSLGATVNRSISVRTPASACANATSAPSSTPFEWSPIADTLFVGGIAVAIAVLVLRENRRR